MSQVVDFMQSSINRLHKMGVADVIIDPGFGFNKTEQQNYTILRDMDILHSLRVPILVGISRKSMLYNPLGLTPADVLPATIAAHTIALDRGAKILRVHDVAAAKQAITVYSLTQQQTPK
jgi:dihydropteroate synthase